MPLLEDHRSFQIALLPGDGQGPQLASFVERTLGLIQDIRRDVSFKISKHDFGGVALATDAGTALPSSTLDACRQSDAVIVCGCGDPRYGIEPEQGLLALRQELGASVNIRPARFPSAQLVQQSSYKPDLVERLDITFFRDLTGGVYYGPKQEAGEDGEAYDITKYSRQTIERLARLAGKYAMQFTPPKPVHSIDKHNVMATSRLWRSVVTDIFQQEFPQVPLNHVLVDTASMLLASNPLSLNGIILAENMFGDILSDQAGGVLGSPNILASAAVPTLDRRGSSETPGIFEPLNLKPREKLENPLGIIQAVGLMLGLSLGLTAESDALSKAIRRTLDPVELVGSDVRTVDLGGTATAGEFMETLLHNLDYYLEALNSAEAAVPQEILSPPATPESIDSPMKRRPMGVIEKILTHAGVGLTKPQVETGDMICVKVDWTLTSELLWAGMEKTYDQMGRPRPYRNDRLWLAVDHTVDPRTNHQPRQKGLIAKAERFRREAKIIDFLPANTSIMHTDFTRERAQPGRIVVGSDSHTCSAGSMGSFAIGFGAADVVMPMVTGETWFRVPEVCRINFVGKLPFGVGGKDVILHILGLFKRNTIAFQRAVEYGGPGLKELSMDARFAISNMNTEFGGMGSCFEADEETAAWISRRQQPEHREGGLYFRADPDAKYVEERTIDLSEVRVTMALYPNPDDVVPILEKAGMKLDGCFIGACTTTEEDLIVGALILEAGLQAGMRPKPHGKRRVTPGRLLIIKRLERHGLLDIYKQAGFSIGAPGCSYCVGINDVDVAGEGEVWLSSQNRNFRNRMGKGSIGNITCAAAVAASSFDMVVTDPKPLLDQLDRERLEKLVKSHRSSADVALEISEPSPEISSNMTPNLLNGAGLVESTSIEAPPKPRLIRSRVQRFGENVDTSDAIIPAEFMPGVDNADLGSHCFQYFRPSFREKAKCGSRIIVADHGFGSGSSREDAVRALQGAGIEAVIAKGFAFIYERNQLNMGLFNIKLQDPEFYEVAQEDSVISIDKENKTITVEGHDGVFYYEQSDIEETLLESGGVLPLHSQLGSKVFRRITMPRVKGGRKKEVGNTCITGLLDNDQNSSFDW
ncbi:3-isopropylmalate dehydrogenase [Fusarium albosuccineum]|uniref:3-isopropylmalate dehydrogenase n=1 Tax=Fusarium albosuccineum TaxID=1237068 RepID=A0A8H4KJP7_9HYPO|nr:3-isopropylmalate dehydrogenase [Fusarium albosuccineum]